MTKHFKKIAIAIIVVLMFNFIVPTQSHALDPGGILLKPITSFLVIPVDFVNAFISLNIIIFCNGGQGDFSGIIDEFTIDKATEEMNNEDNQYKDEIQSLPDAFNGAVSTMTENFWGWIVTMEDFFKGNIAITDINIFDNADNDTSVIESLKNSVAGWYYTLRNIAGVGLLIALIYTAIRILLSSIAEEKAHYKSLLMDWLKAVCLVVFVHVLMIAIIYISDALVDVLSDSVGPKYSILAYVRGQMAGSWDTNQIGFLIIYSMLTYYTICFLISYFKRFFYTMILIIIAPIVSLMYAFGKQGKEVFSKWLKEFIYNALLQPFHLLIYTVLFGWVIALLQEGGGGVSFGFHNTAVTLLAIIVAHFIRDAEKYYRELFGMGHGVAGIGAVDTGDKTVKEVKKKVKEVAKATTELASKAALIYLTGGMAAGGAATSSMAATGTEAGAAAGAMGEDAAGFASSQAGTNLLGAGPGPGGPSPDGPLPGGPLPGGPLPGGPSPDGPLPDSGGPVDIDEPIYEDPEISTVEPIHIDSDSVDMEAPDVDEDGVVEYEVEEAESLGPNKIDNLSVGQLNAVIAEAGVLNADSQDVKDETTKLNTDIGKPLDHLISAITGKSSNIGQTMDTIRHTTDKIDEDPNLSQMSDKQKAAIIADSVINGDTIQRNGDNESGGTGNSPVMEGTATRGEGEEINVTDSSTIELSSSDSKIEDILKNFTNSGLNGDEIAQAVEKRLKDAGIDPNSAAKMVENAVNSQSSSSSSSSSSTTTINNNTTVNETRNVESSEHGKSSPRIDRGLEGRDIGTGQNNNTQPPRRGDSE